MVFVAIPSFAATLALLCILASLTNAAVGESPAAYYADLGPYGTFEMVISADDGTMTWSSNLQNLNELQETLGVTIPALNYHLHQQWTSIESDFAIGGDGCGADVTGGHYDPFLGCGPASGVSEQQCLANDKARTAERYMCTPEVYSGGAYFECEVGDLSGKDGPIPVSANGVAIQARTKPDPLPAIEAQYEGERVVASPDKFASIVFHNGSPRVLCGKLFVGTPAGDSPTVSSSTVTLPSLAVWSVAVVVLARLVV